jgi:hypothetical protein
MTLPGFTAEAATAPASQPYGYVSPGGGAGGLVPAAFGSRFPPFPEIRCCGYSRLLQRYVCTTRRQAPWETCQCRRTPLGDPYIACTDNVFTPA